MKKWSPKTLFQDFQLEVFTTLGLIVAAGLYLIRLGSLPSHMSANELAAYQSNHSLHAIVNNPLNAPYNVIDYILLHIPGHTMGVARLTSVLFALLAICLFFTIMMRWHGKRTAWMATALFATSGWLLHVGRLGTADILWLIIPLTLILLNSWLAKTERHGTALITVAALFGLMLFVPAAIWFVIAFALIASKDLLKHHGAALVWQRLIASAILILLLVALVFLLHRAPGSNAVVREWAGIPKVLPSYMSMGKVWVSSMALYPFFRGPAIPELWLGHTPILDVFTSTMCLLGAYFYLTHFKNLRTRLLATLVVIGSVLTALNGAAAMSFIVPVLYLIAATGITYLLHKWLTVFPRNPVARFAGVTFIVIAIATAVTYHMISYFVAWQHNPDTVATFQRKP
jgi:MFS family permease